MRSVEDDRSRWRTHVLTAPWADKPLSRVTATDAAEWLSTLCAKRSSNPTHKHRVGLLAASTVKNALNLVRSAFQAATEEGFCRANHFRLLRVRRSRFARTRDKWTFLYPSEFSVLSLLPKPERQIARLAMLLGARQSELWGLHLSDVHLDAPKPFVVVRFSKARTKGSSYAPEPTKSGKPRIVPVIRAAREPLRAWIAELPSFAPENPRGLVFPKPNGSARSKGRLCRAWSRVGRALGRPFRFHDLRHSCATALLAGWLTCKAWPLRAVQQLLGHSSVVMTEKYAHVVEEFLMLAAASSDEESMIDETTLAAKVAIDEEGEFRVEVAPVGHLSSVVEQRFRNSDASPAGAASGTDATSSAPSDADAASPGDDAPAGGGGDEPPSRDAEAARALGLALNALRAIPRRDRARVLAALRAFFPGEWPGDRAWP